MSFLVISTAVSSQNNDKQKDQSSSEVKTESDTSEIPFEKLLEDELNRETNAVNTVESTSPNWGFQILKTIIGLGFIIFVIFLFKKYMIFKSSFGTPQTDIIKTLHEYPVGTGKKMQLIEVGNKILLIGVSDAGLQLISEFKEKASIDQIKMSIESQPAVEARDLWIEASKIISNKIQTILKGKKNFSNYENLNSGNWRDIQNNARNKIDELREKKKVFEEKDIP